MKARGGVGGGIAAALIFLAKVGGPVLALLGKFKFLLILGKFLVTGGSMFISMFFWSTQFGWPLAIAFVLSIFFHECGHAIAGKSRGIPISGMVFIPFMGAAVLLKRGGRSVVEDAFIGIMGPVFGTIYGFGSLGLFAATGSRFWLVLASFVFFMNLFNLIPMPPLDGGWIVPVFSPKVLAFGMLLVIPIGFLNPLIWLLGLLSLPRVIAGWKQPPEQSDYFRVRPADRLTYALAYPGLAAILALAWTGSQHFLLYGTIF